MSSVCGSRELSQEQQEENKLTVLNVEEGNEHSEQSSHGDLTHQLPVAMVGTECQCAFAQVSQTLWRQQTAESVVTRTNNTSTKFDFCLVQSAFCVATHLSQSDHEEIVGVFGMILCQLPQHGSQTGIICA